MKSRGGEGRKGKKGEGRRGEDELSIVERSGRVDERRGVEWRGEGRGGEEGRERVKEKVYHAERQITPKSRMLALKKLEYQTKR